jgi:hypothetical protein
MTACFQPEEHGLAMTAGAACAGAMAGAAPAPARVMAASAATNFLLMAQPFRGVPRINVATAES